MVEFSWKHKALHGIELFQVGMVFLELECNYCFLSLYL